MSDNCGNDTLLESVAGLLSKGRLTVSCAESCTGGLLSGRIIDLPGASDITNISFVTYSNEAKMEYLGVGRDTLEKYGAVSAETAGEMVKGLVSRTGADAGLATTGIAGPGGGSDAKPVGLVYIGCSVCGNVTVKECRFDGDRMQVRRQSVEEALKLLHDCLTKYYTENDHYE